MRVLIAGNWHSELHEESVHRALISLGHESIPFPWHQYFRPRGIVGRFGLPFLKAQNKYMAGPLVWRLNQDLLARIAATRPDFIFIYRGTHVFPETLAAIRRMAPRPVLIGYNNDDPFSPQYPQWQWRHFLAGVPEYDLVFAYRERNLAELTKVGAKRVGLLRSWYIQDRNYPVELTDVERQRYGCDIVFIGHYENDGRIECLEEIAKRGYRLRLYGHDHGWNQFLPRSQHLRHLYPTSTVWGAEYNKAIAGAKIALCFLSKLNRDTYTRRCFEIPATGTMLLAEHSSDMEYLFAPGVEAELFKDKNELIRKVEWYIDNPDSIRGIAAAGRRRVVQDGHDVVSRVAYVIDLARTIK